MRESLVTGVGGDPNQVTSVGEFLRLSEPWAHLLGIMFVNLFNYFYFAFFVCFFSLCTVPVWSKVDMPFCIVIVILL